MPKKKQKKQEEGAPAWMMTYGDMMTLLLCFFVIIVAMSEIKKEDQFRQVVEEVRKAFGSKGGGGHLPTKQDPKLSMVKTLEEIQLRRQRKPKVSEVHSPSMVGKEPRVVRVREGIEMPGGRIVFEPGSAELTEVAKQQLRKLAGQLKGKNNKIEVRGHTSPMEIEMSADYPDAWSLGFARARAVMNYLTSEELARSFLDIEAERLRPASSGDFEPLRRRAYTPDEHEPNRRVEILVHEALVKDYQTPELN